MSGESTEWNPIFEVGKFYPSTWGTCLIVSIGENGKFIGKWQDGAIGESHMDHLEPVVGVSQS